MSVFTVGLIYIFAVLATSGALLSVGWRNRQGSDGLTAGGVTTGRKTAVFHGDDFGGCDLNADAGIAIRQVLRRLTPMIVSKSIQIDFAAPVGLTVRMQAAALTEMLEDLVTAAVHLAPASRMVLTATARGDRVYISIADDMPNADEDMRRASLRMLIERVGRRGASLDVFVLPSEGTIMTLRLAAGDVDPHLMLPIEPPEEAHAVLGTKHQLRYDPLISM